MNTLQKIFTAVTGVEETVLPIFIHSPGAQAIVGAILVSETIFASVFGLKPAVPPAPPAHPPA